MTPPVIFFDAVGTLLHPNPPAVEVYAEVGRRHGSRLETNALAARFRNAFRKQEQIDRFSGWRTDEDRESRRWRDIVGQTLSDVLDPEACFDELFAHFARPGAWRVEPETGTVLRAMADAGWRIGLASNFDARLRGVAAGLAELRPVSPVVVSSEVGWRKPAAAFFDAVVRAAGVAREQIVFVGDDPVNDYDGARTAGLAAVLYDPLGETRDAALRRVARLADLLDDRRVTSR